MAIGVNVEGIRTGFGGGGDRVLSISSGVRALRPVEH
jgi:hypothetical protein